MHQGNTTVLQVNKQGEVVKDVDTSLSRQELLGQIQQDFPKIQGEDGVMKGTYEGHPFWIRAKNITYLGIPHPPFKKRIQIAEDLQNFYQSAQDAGAVPVLLGVYTYQDLTLYCEFAIEDYVGRKAHNSSAHIYTNDLLQALRSGYTTKVDENKNHLTIFTREEVGKFLSYKFQQEKVAFQPEIVQVMDTFFDTIPKYWEGISCYQEMIAAEDSNKFQPEWPGFYLEYLIKKNIRENALEHVIRYAPDKRNGGIDLDLFFPTLQIYGDLKTHDVTSSGIIGNDWDTIYRLLYREEAGSIYYIVLNVTVEKDSNFDYTVTKFWNQAQGKENLMSYSGRMKHGVTLTGYDILDINKGNFPFLRAFRQGRNSNGNARNEKIMVGEKELGNFLVYRKIFQ